MTDSFLSRWEKIIKAMPLRNGDTPRRWRHKARGTTYTLIGPAQVQAPDAYPLTDYEVVQVYQGDDGELWVRRSSEFFDGRFEPIDHKRTH